LKEEKESEKKLMQEDVPHVEALLGIVKSKTLKLELTKWLKTAKPAGKRVAVLKKPSKTSKKAAKKGIARKKLCTKRGKLRK